MNIRHYIGNCVHSLDTQVLDSYGVTDATELAQALEDSQEMSLQQFKNFCYIKPQHSGRNFVYGKSNKGFYYAYDTNKDIHYFYG